MNFHHVQMIFPDFQAHVYQKSWPLTHIASSSDGKGTELEAQILAEGICKSSANILREERSIKVQNSILSK